jgi:hypothetical protein
MGFSLVIIVVVLAGLFFFFKFKETQHKLSLWLIGGFVLFALVSVWTVYSRHEVDLTTFEGFMTLMKFYGLWLEQVGHNVVDITGYVVHKSWGSSVANVTNMTQ